MRKELKLICEAFRDLLIRFLPRKIVRLLIEEGQFAFVVHPRNISDFNRKYSFVKKIPSWAIEKITKFLWPVVVSQVTGLRDKMGQEIKGWVVCYFLTPKQMLENRDLANKKVLQTVNLAEKIGAKIVGLGALASSMTNGGVSLLGKVKTCITTGRAFTSITVTGNVFKLAELLEIDLQKALIAVVGAAGSIGSASAKILADRGVKNLLLVDVERKEERLKELIDELYKINKNLNISFSFKIHDIIKADIVIAATNTPDQVINSEDLKPGAIVIDDAQPSDVSSDVIKNREDVIVVEGGVVNAPGIDCHFNFGLANKNDTFSCLAEVLILSFHQKEYHNNTGRTSNWQVQEISQMAKDLNFQLGDFQNFYKIITKEDIERLKKYRAINID